MPSAPSAGSVDLRLPGRGTRNQFAFSEWQLHAARHLAGRRNRPTSSGTFASSAISRHRACRIGQQTIVPSLHNFTHDVYFYAKNTALSQAPEFDINRRWHPTGIPCDPVNGWNHLVIRAQRTPDNRLLFKFLTLNGKTAKVNCYFSPTKKNWYGVTINYQQDGNYGQQPYLIWLDKLNFKVW